MSKISNMNGKCVRNIYEMLVEIKTYEEYNFGLISLTLIFLLNSSLMTNLRSNSTKIATF